MPNVASNSFGVPTWRPLRHEASRVGGTERTERHRNSPWTCRFPHMHLQLFVYLPIAPRLFFCPHISLPPPAPLPGCRVAAPLPLAANRPWSCLRVLTGAGHTPAAAGHTWRCGSTTRRHGGSVKGRVTAQPRHHRLMVHPMHMAAHLQPPYTTERRPPQSETAHTAAAAGVTPQHKAHRSTSQHAAHSAEHTEHLRCVVMTALCVRTRPHADYLIRRKPSLRTCLRTACCA